MAHTPRLSNEAASAAADAVTAFLPNGYLRIYDGTQPETVNTAITTQMLLAELRYNAGAAFHSAVDGVAEAYTITGDASAKATGTASWFRALKSDGTTAAFDGSVGTSGADLNLDRTSIVATGTVDVIRHSYTQPKS